MFGKNGYGLILNGRRVDRLISLKTRLEDDYGIRCHLLPFDVQSRRAVFTAIDSLPEDWRDVDILLNRFYTT